MDKIYLFLFFLSTMRTSALACRETVPGSKGGGGKSVTHAESFEICEYGRIPDDQEIRRLFPMLGK
jgi:hypothetical protein